MRRIAILCCALASAAWAQCGTEEERIIHVREKLVPTLPAAQLETLRKYLELGTRSCPTSGDLWYYRSLLEQKTGTANMAKYALTQAQNYGSEALQRGIDPFRMNDRLLRVDRSLPPALHDKWALVVGVQEFQDPSIPTLHFTAKDAHDFAAGLTDPESGRFKKENVRVLVDRQATVRGIREGIGWLRERVKPDDLVVIYISTHGSPKTMDRLGVSYIIANDTEIEPPEKLYSSAYQMVDFVEDLNRDVPAKRLAVFIDTCHSGAAIRQAETVDNESPDSAAGFSGAFRAFELGPGRAVLTASRAEEESWESSRIGNGYFTHFLIEAMRQKSGMSTVQEIADYVRERVKAAVASDLHHTQTPVFGASEQGGAIVLGAPVS
jgi:hypothetical protein